MSQTTVSGVVRTLERAEIAVQQDDPMQAVRRTLAEIDWLANRLQAALAGDDPEPVSAAISVQAA